MANKQRIEQLKKYLLEEPNDPFLKYALAMEFLETDPQKTMSLFEVLLNDHPNYIGTYFHAASLQAGFGYIEKAEMIYIKGIEKAKELNEAHALKELKAAYLNFQIEYD